MVKTEEAVKEIQKKFKIIGRSEELRKIILAHKIGKNILIEGEVGVGKTTLARATASYFDTEFYRIDCSEETLPHNLVGFWDESYIYGPLARAMKDGGCLFINEINRMPESTQNTLLTALDERILEVPKLTTLKAGNGFFTIATLNPTAHIGVTALGEAIKDRFVWIKLEYQTPEDEIKIIKQETNIDNDNEDKITSIAEKIILNTRNHVSIRRGSSIRGAIDLAALVNETDSIESSKNWVDSAIMALHNKIDLEDGISKTKKEVISDIVLAVLNRSDFQ